MPILQTVQSHISKFGLYCSRFCGLAGHLIPDIGQEKLMIRVLKDKGCVLGNEPERT